MHRGKRGENRTPGARQVRHQGGAVYDESSIQEVATTPVAQRPGGRPPTLGESPGGLTFKDYFAK